MTTVERLFSAILHGLFLGALIAGACLVFDLRHIWPGAIAAFALGAISNLGSSRRTGGGGQ